MKLAIMQPYFLPYLGYFQLMSAVDVFVVYDNIKYTKKGWVNRNRLLRQGEPALFTLPLAHGPDQLHVRDRHLSPSFDRTKLMNQFAQAYRQAPRYAELLPLLDKIITFPNDNLFAYIRASIELMREQLGLSTELVISSSIAIDHELKGQDKVIAICRKLGASSYLNPTGGTDLYQHEAFRKQGIDLRFLRSRLPPYSQGNHSFIPGLSIIDVLMFNSPEAVSDMLRYDFDLH